MKNKITLTIAFSLLIQGAVMAEGIFIHSHNDSSNRYAILDETEKVAFLYLTHKGTQKPEKDAIAYMRIIPPENYNWEKMAETGETPLLSKEVASASALIINTKEEQFSFTWSKDGNSAALNYKGLPIALVSLSENIGRSKAVKKENKLTNPWNQAVYENLFE